LGFHGEESLRSSDQSTLSALDSLDGFLFLDPAAFPFGKIVVVTTQDRLDVLLKIFAELTYLFFDMLSCFDLRHSVFTYLSTTKKGPRWAAVLTLQSIWVYP